jgi:gamma-glutamyl-gamma-aminobutyrate hydrolase PuuD
MPLLAICRGAQETNVALGGSLHQAVHEVGPFNDHRADETTRRPCKPTGRPTRSRWLPGGG